MSASSIPRLPRDIELDPAGDAIRTRLTAPGRPLWAGGQTVAPVLPLHAPFADALAAAYHGGHLVLGLEPATDALAAEAHGLALVARRPGAHSGARVSRLLLVSDDGAERLYRHAERLALEHAPRVLIAILAADAATLGRATTAREANVKLVLVQHKLAVSALLRALAT